MKLRTSFFNPTLYKKNITRFAPLWILYTVAMMLLMLSLMGEGNYPGRENYLVDVLAETVGGLSVVNLLYGVMAAQLLFGELFNTRLCNALHAMPIRRETRFVSHLAAGLSFSIVPNLLVGVLMMQNLECWWYVSLLWCLAMTLQYLFFFGVAVLAMLCTGNRFAAVLVYAIVNFASMAALWFASVIFVPLMKGVILDWEGFALFSPVVKMVALDEFFSVDAAENMYYFDIGEQWPLLWIYAAVGVAAMAGALLIYRRRALECAGDFMAVKPLRPIFLVIYTLCVGAFFAVFGSIFGGNTYVTFLIVGFAVGFFTGKMLLERSIRVFNLKSLLHLGILVVLMWLALQAVQFDVFGIERYVPKPDAVKEAEIAEYYYGRNNVTVINSEELKTLQKAHELAIQEEGCMHGDQQTYEIAYHMKDGRTIKRRYSLCRREAAFTELEKLFCSPEAILGFQGHWDNYTRSVTSIRVTGMARQEFLDAESWINFLDCLYADCENGMVGSKGGNVSRYEVTIWSGGSSVHLQIRDNSTAYDWLQAYEKQEMLNYVKQITSITLDKELIDESHYEELVSALYADAWEYSYDGWEIFERMQYDAVYTLRIKTDFYTPEEELPIGQFTRNTYEWIKDYLYGIDKTA